MRSPDVPAVGSGRRILIVDTRTGPGAILYPFTVTWTITVFSPPAFFTSTASIDFVVVLQREGRNSEPKVWGPQNQF